MKRRPAALVVGLAVPLLLCMLYVYRQRPDPAIEATFYPAAAAAAAATADTQSTEPTEPGAWLTVPTLGRLPADGSVFLLETSGRRWLTPREWCAVESASRADPTLLVVVLVTARALRRAPLVDLLLARANVRLAYLDLAALFAGSPMADWYRSRVVLRSRWAVSHMSDAVRFALLLRYGGVYLDTDVVVRRSLAALDDGAGLESAHAVAAGVLKFGRGSHMARRLAERFAADYNPNDFGHNGPGVVTAELADGCRLTAPPFPPSHCGNYTIYGSPRFYPIAWPDWRLFFEPAAAADVLQRADSADVVHTWGTYSRNRSVVPGSAYYRLAGQHCPDALRLGGDHF